MPDLPDGWLSKADIAELRRLAVGKTVLELGAWNIVNDLAPTDKFLDGLTIHPNGCWGHSNRPTKWGYLRVSFRNRRVYAHRMMYEWLVGPIPAGLEIDHLCRNRWCINPSHLEPVTQRENWLRGETPSAQFARRTHCAKGHPLDGIHRTPGRAPYRRCRTCGREYWHRKKAKTA